MKISAEIIADSVSPAGKRLTTLQITFPRFILPEFNTHRMFSRNFRSSRAVPVAKLLEEVRTSPYEPLVWLKNKPGMQGGEPMSREEEARARADWLAGAREAADRAEQHMKNGLHKQWANRAIEPYVYVHGVVTATEWDNFFALRAHEDAQPEIRELAEQMLVSMAMSQPQELLLREWHLPYITQQDRFDALDTAQLLKVSVARCARVSYLTHDGRKTTIEEDLALYERLAKATPPHASPLEHQARAMNHPDNPYANFRGWQPLRNFIETGGAL